MSETSEKYQQKNPFSVPEGYFDSLEDRIIRQVSQMEKPRRAGMVRFLRPFMGWAALLVIVVLAARWATGVPSQEMNITDPQLDADFNPTTEEILEYLTQEVNLAVLSNEILEE